MGEDSRAARSRWLAAVRARVSRARQENDPRYALDPAALAEVSSLLDVISPASDMEALREAGWLHWLRFLALSAGEWWDEYEKALTMFAPVLAVSPWQVPVPVRALLGQGPPNDDATALTGAVGELRAAIASLPTDHPVRGALLNSLGIALRNLFLLNHERSLLNEAEAVHRAAVDMAAANDPNLPVYLTNLSADLAIHAEESGDPALLSESLTLGRAALAAVPADAPEMKSVCQSHLANGLQVMYDATRDRAYLVEAAALQREALTAVPVGHPDRAADLCNLGNTLLMIYMNGGDPQVLAEAVSEMRAGIAAAPPGLPFVAGVQGNLCIALQELFRATGEREALTGAIEAGRVAVGNSPLGSRHRANHLAALGNTLVALFISEGDRQALAEAVELLRAAVQATPADSFRYGAMLTNLGAALTLSFERTGNGEHLSEAVSVLRTAVDATPSGHPDRAGYVGNLSAALMRDAETRQDQKSREEAVSAARLALEAAQAHPDRASRAAVLTNLAGVLKVVFDATGDPAVLDEAISKARLAVEETPSDYPDRGGNLNNLSHILRAQFELTGDAKVLSAERETLAEAVACTSAPVKDRFQAGRALAQASHLAGDVVATLDAMERAVGLMPRLVPRDLRRADREYRLGRESGVASQAAAAALSAGQPQRAVELLEQARGLLLSEAMGDRTGIGRLRGHPELAAEFARLRELFTQLEEAPVALADTGAAAQGQVTGAYRLTDRRRGAADQWASLLASIRAQRDLADFLAPPSVQELRSQAGPGPIVMLNPSGWGCDALVLTSDPDEPVRHIPLPDLTHEDIELRVQGFHAARQAVTRDPESAIGQAAARDLDQFLAWLWDTIAEPIVVTLGYTRSPGHGETWPRLWWCPVGVAAYLPIHAAGHHQEALAGDDNPRTVLDRVVSSYTATIRSLAYTRSGPSQASPGRPALIVAAPVVSNAPHLRGVVTELEHLSRLLPEAVILEGKQATYGNVRKALPRHGVTHFACHGRSDWTDPAASLLLLHDHQTQPLTVSDISRLHLDGAELAYLSACSTSETSPQLTDEAVHITAAFQLAGYRNVIGSIWPVSDIVAAQVAVEVYLDITRNGSSAPETGRSARALHDALRRMRGRKVTPAKWAAHIHAGG